MLARLRTVSTVAHGSDAHKRRHRRDYDYDDYVLVYGCDLPGPGGLLRLGHGVKRVGSALRRVMDARSTAEGDEDGAAMSLGDKVVVFVDVVVGGTNIVVGACDIGVCDFVVYARGALARLRLMASSGGGANSKPYLIEGGTTTSTGVKNDVTGRGLSSDHCHRKQIREKGKYDVRFEDLPEEIVHVIFSKLELKEDGRTSVLSSKWRNMWMICPKLRFDGSRMCGKYVAWEHHTQKFIDNVNEVLALQHSKVIETLEIKIGFDKILVDHLDNWVSFAAASGTKNLALDLVSKGFCNYLERYIFPFELFDGETMSNLQQIQLSFVSFKLPSRFSGFQKLKKLDLHLLHASRKELQDMLSGCSNLEWLSIDSCNLKDELIVDRPLSHLLYLCVAHCKMTKIKLPAAKLRTSIYEGLQLFF